MEQYFVGYDESPGWWTIDHLSSETEFEIEPGMVSETAIFSDGRLLIMAGIKGMSGALGSLLLGQSTSWHVSSLNGKEVVAQLIHK